MPDEEPRCVFCTLTAAEHPKNVRHLFTPFDRYKQGPGRDRAGAKRKLFTELEDATLYWELGHMSDDAFIDKGYKAVQSFLVQRKREIEDL